MTSSATVGSAIGHPVLLELVRTGPNAPVPTTTSQNSVPINMGHGNQAGGGPGYGRSGTIQQNNFNNRNGKVLKGHKVSCSSSYAYGYSLQGCIFQSVFSNVRGVN